MDHITISKADVWKAIWLDNNRPAGAVSDFLKSLLPSRKAPVSTTGTVKVAIVVGHNKKAPGAQSLMPEPEYHYNSRVADRMVELAASDPRIEIKVFYRKSYNSYTAQIKDVYSRVNKYDPAVCLELHFNWIAGAGRIEMLHYPESEKGESLGAFLLLEAGKLFDGTRKLVTRASNQRGGLSLVSCKAPCVMTEPFDCSHKGHVSSALDLGADGMAHINFNALKAYLRKWH